jgi:hypothetical protein
MDSTMNDLKPKAANVSAISRLPFASLVFLALSIIAPARTALPQSSNNNVLNPPSVTNPLHQTSNFGGDTGSGGFDSILVERRMKMLNNERRKSLVSDSDRLLKLATELNNEIAHSNSGSLTPEQLRKVADIEKLAHGVRDKMVMTIAAPSAAYFPASGSQ